MSLVSLIEAKLQLNGISDKDDAELQGFLEAAIEKVEELAGPVVPRTVTQLIPACGYSPRLLVLDVCPVLSLVSFTPTGGTAVDKTAVPVPANGVLDPGTFGYAAGTLTYRVGMDPVPQSLKRAALIITQHLWETQRSGLPSGGIPGSGEADTPTGAGYALPNRAMELIGNRRGPRVA